jgi:cytochrome c peroxidase
MRATPCQPLKLGPVFLFLAFALAAIFVPFPAIAQQPTNFGSASGITCPGGNVICNGSINFLTTELFFEPETPAESLKAAPTSWNELEQLLDNPYVYTWGAACNDGGGLVPGTYQGHPTYCTTSPTAAHNPGTFIRRPNAVDAAGNLTVSTLPPLLVHPLNYNPQSGFGVEMRILNPNYAGGNFKLSGTVTDPFSVTRQNPTGAVQTGICYTLGGACVPATEIVNVSSGASRGLTVGTATAPGTTEIDMNVILGRDLNFCQINPEPVPIFGTFSTTGMSQSTSFDSENLTTCGGDPGEPGAASRAHNNTNLALCTSEVLGANSLAGYLCEDNIGLPYVGQATTSSYSIPAVPAPSVAVGMLMQVPNRGITTANETGVAPFGAGVVLDPAAGFQLTDPARGGVIQPLNIATGVGGLHKPSLRKVEVGGNGANPNYLWNSLSAVSAARPDPTGADLQPANENDFVGLYSPAGTAPATNADFMTQKQAARLEAMALGKSLFWDQQVGSDGVQACGSCHAHAGADNRTKNQLNPNGQDGLRGNPTNFAGTPGSVFAPFPPNYDLQRTDFPLMKLKDPDIAGDPLCIPAIRADVTGIDFPDGGGPDNPKGNVLNFSGDNRVCDAANQISDTEEVASSMGVHFGLFGDIPAGTGTGLTLTNTPGAAPVSPFGPPSNGVRALIHDQRSPIPADNIDPIPGFAGTPNADGSANQFRRVEPRNTPTIILADLNFDNFWDGRARHDDNGGSVFGPADPQSHVWVDQGTGLTATRQLIRFSSLGSLAKGPALSKFEMSFDGRNWAKLGKKLLQAGVTPLANQLVDPTDSILGRYSNQGGSACAALPATDRSPAGGPPTATGLGVPGLCISYPALIRHAFYPALHSNITQHLNGCYTDGRADIHPNQCAAGSVAIPVLSGGAVVNSSADPFDNYVLQGPVAGAAVATDSNQFTQMEANMSLFWGQSIHVWATILVPDETPDDKFLEANPDTGAANGEVGEPLLVLDIPNCPNPSGYHRGYFIGSDGFVQYRGSCFTEVGNFKRDAYNPNDIVFSQNDTVGHPRMTACTNEILVAGTRTCTERVAAGGTRKPGDPDPLLGFDIFFGANMSLKNPNYRSARCGACHNSPALTDNTGPFTVKAQELDNLPEFQREDPTVEPLTEPMIRPRVISGFLLESEVNEPGQDAIERKAGNLGIAPAPMTTNGNCVVDNCWGYAFPDAITAKVGPDGTYSDASGGYIIHHDIGSGPVAGVAPPVQFTGFGGTFLDNGVYNIGVRPCVADEKQVTGACEDTGRGNTDPFGWPLSLSALMLKNFGGPGQEPGVPITQFSQNNNNAAGRGDALPCTPYCSTGGLLEMSKQDQRINPGYSDETSNPQVPGFLAPFLNKIPVGDEHPQADEACGPVGGCVNTLMDVANEEGFPESAFNARSSTVEVLNGAQAAGDASFIPGVLVNGNCPAPNGPGSTLAGVHCNNSPSVLKTTAMDELGSNQMGTWPVVNKVNRFGSFKAPQIREAELTGPYFHNGGKLTLRQVIDFYVRGGDFPVTNSNHRDFNILNLNAELQSDLSEEEKVALVDYMLELTDPRVATEAAPFDHPQMILPLDGTAPESDGVINRDAMLTGCVAAPAQFGPGQQLCTGPAPAPAGATGPLFLNVPATGAAGNPGGRIPNFLGIAGSAPDAANPGGRQRLVGAAAFCGTNITSQYCH